ncbi:hypothetical protein AAES_78372 [Amazona aestiva]|uniref:Uncharacterized protein n=1 Tax=Amazona aestiva TaxID=12930 RepID=A0A0Q3Q0G9_AMAAE|nr:hypothetical protein AAES_78372 [Amazona aestiva]
MHSPNLHGECRIAIKFQRDCSEVNLANKKMRKIYVDMTVFLDFVYLFTDLISENIRNAGNLQVLQASPLGLKVISQERAQIFPPSFPQALIYIHPNCLIVMPPIHLLDPLVLHLVLALSAFRSLEAWIIQTNSGADFWLLNASWTDLVKNEQPSSVVIAQELAELLWLFQRSRGIRETKGEKKYQLQKDLVACVTCSGSTLRVDHTSGWDGEAV